MNQWKRIHEKATGALPVGTLTKWGVVVVSLLLAAFILSQSLFNSAPEEETVIEAGVELPAGPGTQAQVSARIREESLRQEAQRQAAERTLQRRRQLGLSTSGDTPGNTPTTFPSGDGGDDPIAPSSEAEAELREILRLEELERRRRSLRSSPVAQTYRAATATPAAPAAAGTPAATEAAPAQVAQTYAPPPAVDQALQQTLGILNSAVAEMEAAAEAETTPPEHEGEATPPSALGEPARVLTGTTRDYDNPPLVSAPSDPPGFERIYEGSFLEAVLVTQLSGDFPGPVLASVSVPFYSADRQRIWFPVERGRSARQPPSPGWIRNGCLWVSIGCFSRTAVGLPSIFKDSISSERAP